MDASNAAYALAVVTAKNAAILALDGVIATTPAFPALPTGGAKAVLSVLTSRQSDFTDDKARLETANTAAVASVVADKTAAAVAFNAATIATAAIGLNTASQGTFTLLITDLTAFLNTTTTTGINAAIEAKKVTIDARIDDVETQTRAVATANEILADNDISKAEAVTILEDLKADVANIDAQIAAKILLVAKWKALLDAALA